MAPIRLPIAFLAVYLALTGCVKHVSTLTPAQNFQLTTDQALDVLARANQTIEKTVTTLPAGLLAVNTQRAIVSYTDEAAKVIANAHTALSSGQTVAQRSAAVLAALQAVQQLPPDVQAFVNNPGTAQTATNLVVLIQNSISLAKALMSNTQTNATTAGGN